MGSMEKIDSRDRKILSILTEDARSSLRNISAQVKLSPSSVRNRIKRLEDIGVIERFTIDVDHRLLGLEIQVVVLVTCKPGSSEELYDLLSGYQQVTQIYWTAGPANFILIVRVKDMIELSKLLTGEIEKLPGIERIETHFLMPRS
ncbi:MAG: Lrp/AsnC family transcriptional regulator [Candidatus Thorarchaeota archaeon]|nr:MAG: Lrp/AsnC family transcriptional regulator [Candidatus Thorarchaeota archaeon]